MSNHVKAPKLTLSAKEVVCDYSDFKITQFSDKSVKVLYKANNITRELKREKSQHNFIYFKCKFHRSFLNCKAFIRANLVEDKIVFSSKKEHNEGCVKYGDCDDLQKIKKTIAKEVPESSNLVTNKAEFCLIDRSYPCHSVKLKKRIVREKKILALTKDKAEIKVPHAKCKFCSEEFNDLSFVNMGKCNHKYHFVCLIEFFFKEKEFECPHCAAADTLFSKSVNFVSIAEKLGSLAEDK